MPNDRAYEGGIPSVGASGQDAFYCHCEGCGADGPIGDSHNEAIRLFNTRPTPTDTKGAVEETDREKLKSVIEIAMHKTVYCLGEEHFEILADAIFKHGFINSKNKNALIEQGYMQDWQPIENAPREVVEYGVLGEPFILRTKHHSWITCIARWHEPLQKFTDMQGSSSVTAKLGDGSLWMPLPPSPDTECKG